MSLNTQSWTAPELGAFFRHRCERQCKTTLVRRLRRSRNHFSVSATTPTEKANATASTTTSSIVRPSWRA